MQKATHPLCLHGGGYPSPEGSQSGSMPSAPPISDREQRRKQLRKLNIPYHATAVLPYHIRPWLGQSPDACQSGGRESFSCLSVIRDAERTSLNTSLRRSERGHRQPVIGRFVNQAGDRGADVLGCSPDGSLVKGSHSTKYCS